MAPPEPPLPAFDDRRPISSPARAALAEVRAIMTFARPSRLRAQQLAMRMVLGSAWPSVFSRGAAGAICDLVRLQEVWRGGKGPGAGRRKRRGDATDSRAIPRTARPAAGRNASPGGLQTLPALPRRTAADHRAGRGALGLAPPEASGCPADCRVGSVLGAQRASAAELTTDAVRSAAARIRTQPSTTSRSPKNRRARRPSQPRHAAGAAAARSNRARREQRAEAAARHSAGRRPPHVAVSPPRAGRARWWRAARGRAVC